MVSSDQELMLRRTLDERNKRLNQSFWVMNQGPNLMKQPIPSRNGSRALILLKPQTQSYQRHCILKAHRASKTIKIIFPSALTNSFTLLLSMSCTSKPTLRVSRRLDPRTMDCSPRLIQGNRTSQLGTEIGPKRVKVART